MSGGYRQSLGPALKFLREYIAKAKTLMEEERTEQNLSEMKKEVARMKRTLTRIEQIRSAWRQYAINLPGNEKDEELALYNTLSDPDEHINIAEWIEYGHQSLINLELELAEAETGTTGNTSNMSNNDLHDLDNGGNKNGDLEHDEAEDAPIPRVRPAGFMDDFEAERIPRLRRANPAANTQPTVPIRLPKLSLPTFSGNYLNWPPFWEAFEANVHSLRIPEVQKFTYLLSYLRGSALATVQGYSVTAKNYSTVVDLLKKEFGNTKAIREALQSELINLPSPSYQAHSLQLFVQSIERICRQLKNLGHPDNDPFMLMTIKSKLPRSVLTDIVKSEKTKKDWNVDSLRVSLQDYLTVQMEVNRCANTGRKETFQKPPNRPNNPRVDEVRNFAIIQNKVSPDYRNRPPPPCCFCDDTAHPHWASDCGKVRDRNARARILNEQQRCHLCLRRNHTIAQCLSKCNCKVCNGRHHLSLCPKASQQQQTNKPNPKFLPNSDKANFKKPQVPPKPSEKKPEKAQINVVQAIPDTISDTSIAKPSDNLLMSTEVTVFSVENPEHRLNALLFFDPGSQLSFANSTLLDDLNAPRVGDYTVDVYTAFAKEPTRIKSPQYRLNIALTDGTSEEIIVHSQNWAFTTLEYADLNNGNCKFVSRKPDILISIREFWRFFKRLNEVSPYLYRIDSTVGPILCGTKPEYTTFIGNGPMAAISAALISRKKEPDPEFTHKFWDLEMVGVKDDPAENDDETAMAHFNKNVIKLPDGRYQVAWPWKEISPDLPSNYNLAYRRLVSVLDKLKASQELLQEYHKKFVEQLQKDIIEETTRKPGELEHYLPHHAVITKKLRIVFDASAHLRGKFSLNALLFRGPVLLPDLVGLLLRFRLPIIAVWSDIEGAFLQLSLPESDREVVKFLWLRDPEKPINNENLVIYRFQRVPFGVISSPFLLAATVRHLLLADGSQLALQMAENTYVDNIFIPCTDPEEALQKYRHSKSIFASAKMNLREFISNSLEFNNAIPDEDKIDKPIPKILGIPWDISKDEMVIKFPVVDFDKPVTRRSVLTNLASIFDPCGFCTPILLSAKLFFQSLWDNPIGWDDPIPSNLAENWINIITTWKTESIRISRRILIEPVENIQLHAMVDASKDAYAVSVYLRCISGDICSTNLVYAKSRLRPHKREITIPRMELLAILIGCRGLNFVNEQLKLNPRPDMHLWSDSLPVLNWINSTDIQQRFVENRLREIRKYDDFTFHHIPTECNPADLGTRGCDPDELRKNLIWWRGPIWLPKLEEEWPTTLTLKVDSRPGEVETAIVSTIIEPSVQLITFSRFNSWPKLVNSTIYLLISLQKLLYRQWRCPQTSEVAQISDDEPMSAHNFDLASKFLVKLDQKNLGELNKLRIFKDENGIIRLHTRLFHAEATPSFKNPIILPRNSEMTRLIILDFHEKFLHSGLDATLSGFLAKYWITHARRTVKNSIRTCIRCRKITSPAFSLPLMPSLPADRSQPMAPFTSIGIDYMGPSLTKVNGENVKCWIIIITCLCTRAVYLAPTLNMTTQSLLHVLHRFCARRGTPQRILSDNGTSFVLAGKIAGSHEVNENKHELNKFLAEKGIYWRFLPVMNPWGGAVYERLIAICKNCFKRTLGRKILTYEELETFVCKIEGVMNARPLTFVSDETDACLAISPNQFLHPEGNVEFMLPDDDKSSDSEEEYSTDIPRKAEQIRKHFSTIRTALKGFWAKWQSEYLLMLRERSAWQHKGPRSQTKREPEVGEVAYQGRQI